MKATDLLKDQHREALELLSRIDRRTSAREAEAVVREFATVFGAHALAEDEIFYPACAEAMGTLDAVRRAYHEHVVALAQLRDLLEMAGNDPGFRTQLAVVRKLVEDHFREEERGLFRRAAPIVGDKRLEVLGAQMEDRFDEGIEAGYQVTTAAENVDERDVDRMMAMYMPTGRRVVPKVPRHGATRKDVSSAARHAGENAARAKPVAEEPKVHKHARTKTATTRLGTVQKAAAAKRRKPKSGGEGARKTRSGGRGRQR